MSTLTVKDITVAEVVRLYEVEMWTLRRISDHFSTDHHRIKRTLIAAGVPITNQHRLRTPQSDAQRKALSVRVTGTVPKNKGTKSPEPLIRKMMKARMRTSIDLIKYEDIDKLQLLVRLTSKHSKHLAVSDAIRESFLDKFYFDNQFNALWAKWKASGENKWYFPSLDHKTSKLNGEDWSLDNLQFLSWFENRAKAEMNQDEWDDFKIKTNTSSDLFISVEVNDD
jgi:hypothetical protein